MQTIRIRTPQNVMIEYRLASLGDRMLAYVFDVLVVISYFILLSGLQALSDKWFKFNFLQSLWVQITLLMPWFLYDLLCEVFMEGQSFGKKVMKIKVVRTDGEAASLGNYLTRWLLGLVELKLAGGLLALFAIVIGGKGQRLGDMAAGTTVVYVGDDKQASMQPAPPVSAHDTPPQYPQAADLSDTDINIIKEVLSNYRRTGNRQVVDAAAAKLVEKFGLQRFGEANALEFLKQVIADHSRLVK